MADGSRIDVPKLAADRGLKRAVTAPAFEPTQAQKAQLTRLIREVVASWNEALRTEILPEYRRQIERRAATQGLAVALSGGGVDVLDQALNRAAERASQRVANIEPQVARFVTEFAAWHTSRFVAGIKSAARVDLGAVLSPTDADDLIRAAIRRNVSLIRGLDGDMRKAIERTVYDAWNNNDQAKKLTRTLRKDLGFAPERAKLIGNDQIGKLAGELDKFRHAEANIDQFVWVKTVSPQPRPEHLELVGNVYSWAKPPGGVIPGQLINCKCRARAYIEPRAS